LKVPTFSRRPRGQPITIITLKKAVQALGIGDQQLGEQCLWHLQASNHFHHATSVSAFWTLFHPPISFHLLGMQFVFISIFGSMFLMRDISKIFGGHLLFCADASTLLRLWALLSRPWRPRWRKIFSRFLASYRVFIAARWRFNQDAQVSPKDSHLPWNGTLSYSF
jgi:hypothetical protein